MGVIAKELEIYNIDITAIQETRWEGSGEITKDKYTFLYSGETKIENTGIAFYKKRELVKDIVEFTPIDGRIALLTLKTKNTNISIISRYAPTETTKQEEKDK